MDNGVLKLKSLKSLILDEMDVLLSEEVRGHIYNIFQYITITHQLALFATTIPTEIYKLCKRILNNSEEILLNDKELVLDNIDQYYVAVEKEDYKLVTLFDILQTMTIDEPNQIIVFVNDGEKAKWIRDRMFKNDHNYTGIYNTAIEFINEDLEDIDSIIKQFRAGTIGILISTDILSRGIDINNVSLIVNYDIPINEESYIHRIGRSGRYGKKGYAISFVSDDEEEKLRSIETFYGTKIDELPADLPKID